MQEIQGGVTAAKGFFAAAQEARIKYTNRKDMAMVYSSVPCRAAGTFTSNVVKAACVLWDKRIVEESDYCQAVVVNSGIANACTGALGMDYCRQTAEAMAKTLQIPEDACLVASTGVIGMQLPIDRIKAGVQALSGQLSETKEAGTEAARAIMTTDTHHKEAAVTFRVGGKEVTLGGMCKGSGMIHPNMCTMLAFITTDISISRELLWEAVRESVKDTFNMVSVDGDTSTNDTFLVLANGLAENAEIIEKNEDYQAFVEALLYVSTRLAKMMAGDGEGATALVETHVYHAASREEARRLAKSVICSSLTKAAIFGHDANWGRILCALGYAGVEFDPQKIELFFAAGDKKIQIFKEGTGTDYSEKEASEILAEPEVQILVDMKMGDHEAKAWGCDLTYEYVKINADYRS